MKITIFSISFVLLISAFLLFNYSAMAKKNRIPCCSSNSGICGDLCCDGTPMVQPCSKKEPKEKKPKKEKVACCSSNSGVCGNLCCDGTSIVRPCK